MNKTDTAFVAMGGVMVERVVGYSCRLISQSAIPLDFHFYIIFNNINFVWADFQADICPWCEESRENKLYNPVSLLLIIRNNCLNGFYIHRINMVYSL
uniref:Uncharacterized protein n=1 Tax=Heterorhabditis bacteriophora TaxID=37862 RepID=A0A1I7WRH1_HETBA